MVPGLDAGRFHLPVSRDGAIGYCFVSTLAPCMQLSPVHDFKGKDVPIRPPFCFLLYKHIGLSLFWWNCLARYAHFVSVAQRRGVCHRKRGI